MPDVRNPLVWCRRVTHDAMPTIHRPLWVYGITEWAIPWAADAVCAYGGYTKFKSGIIQYWHKSPSSVGKCSAPLALCHGLGIGVLPYFQFAQELAAGGREVFLLDLP